MLSRYFRAEESALFTRSPWDELPDMALPAPRVCEELGATRLAVSTRTPKVQAWFDQGLRLFHLGWRGEARRAFAQAARLEPGLAMAWWGLALTRGPGSHHAMERTEAIHRALALSQTATDAEQRYIVAATFLADKGSTNGRHGFIREMEGLIDRFPEDAEARLLLAGFLADGYESDGRPSQGQLYAQTLVRELLRTHPHHEGVHHAWVRLMEDSARPEQALESARWLRRFVPGGASALLAAGRLLLRTGHTPEAREALEAAVRQEDVWLQQEDAPPAAACLAGPALRLLVQACTDAGRYGDAQTWARRLRARVEGLTPRLGPSIVLAASVLSRVHLRFGFWRAAAEPRVQLPAESSRAERVLLDALETYARGVNALEQGRVAEAGRACEALDERVLSLAEERRGESQLLCPREVSRGVELAGCDLRGALESRQGEMARAESTLIRGMRLERRLYSASFSGFSRPVRETLARARIRGGRADRALELAESLVAEQRGSGHVWLLLAEVHAARGDRGATARAIASCLECWRDADAHLPELQRARRLGAERELYGGAGAGPPVPLAPTGRAGTPALGKSA